VADATLRGCLALTIRHTVEFSRSGRASVQNLAALNGGNRSSLVRLSPSVQTRLFGVFGPEDLLRTPTEDDDVDTVCVRLSSEVPPLGFRPTHLACVRCSRFSG
jgi:hypothetical protein